MVSAVVVAAIAIAAIAIAAIAIAAVPVAAVPVAAVPVAAIAIAAIAIAAVVVAAVPVTAIVVSAVVVAAIAIAAIVVSAVVVAAVVVAAVPVTAVAVTAVATSSASLSRVHDFKDFSPRDFPHDFQLVRCTLILALCNRTVGDHFSNVVIRVKIIVTETVCGIFAEVHTHIADRRVYIFFKRAGAGVLLVLARPIGVEHLIAFYIHFY